MTLNLETAVRMGLEYRTSPIVFEGVKEKDEMTPNLETAVRELGLNMRTSPTALRW